MFKDDRMISILSAVVLMVAIGTVLQQADGMAWLFGEPERSEPEAIQPAATQPQIQLANDAAAVDAGGLIRIDVLANDEGIGQAHRLGLAVMRGPECGRVFVQEGALQYVSDPSCGGVQQVIYGVPGPFGTLTASVDIAIVGGVEPAPGGDVEAVVVGAGDTSSVAVEPGAPETPDSLPAVVAREVVVAGTSSVPSTEPTGPASGPEMPQPRPSVPELVDPAAGDTIVVATRPASSEQEPAVQAIQKDPLPTVAAPVPPALPVSDQAAPVGTIDASSPAIVRRAPAQATGSTAAAATAQVPAPTRPEPAVGLDVEPPRQVAGLSASSVSADTAFAGGRSGDVSPTASAPQRIASAEGAVAAETLGLGIMPLSDGPAPDPVLDRQSPGFREPPAGSRASGQAGEWMRLAEGAAPIADNRPRGERVAVAEPGEPVVAQDVMVVVIERREPVTTPPSAPIGDLLAQPDTAAAQRPALIPGRAQSAAPLPTPVSLPGADPLREISPPGAALTIEPGRRIQPVSPPAPGEVRQPLPVPAPRGQPAPAETEVAALPPVEIACVEPPSMTLDVRRAGRTIVSLYAPCEAGAVAELQYAGLRLAMPLDSQGRGSVTALGFQSNAPAVLVLPEGDDIDFDLPFKGMDRVSRIALVWDMPVDLELNALEFGADTGTEAHVSPLNRRSFKDVRRSGGGFLDSYRAAYGKGNNVEVYSFYQRRGGPTGVVQMLIDYASRNRDRLQGTCGDGVYASPEYKVLRTLKGRPERPILRRLSAIDCSDVVAEVGDNRLIPGAVEDLLVTRN